MRASGETGTGAPANWRINKRKKKKKLLQARDSLKIPLLYEHLGLKTLFKHLWIFRFFQILLVRMYNNISPSIHNDFYRLIRNSNFSVTVRDWFQFLVYVNSAKTTEQITFLLITLHRRPFTVNRRQLMHSHTFLSFFLFIFYNTPLINNQQTLLREGIIMSRFLYTKYLH